MVSCLAAASYVMIADIYEESGTIDPETMEYERSYVLKKKDVKCYVFPYLDGGIRGAGTTERYTERYANDEFLRIKTSEELRKDWRVANIRNRQGKLIYQEQLTGDPTVYNVQGSAPIVNPLTGGVDEWLSTMERAEIQA